MTQDERVGSLIQKLRRCFRFIHHHADGGKWSQFRVLRELRFHGGMTQRNLREHMNIQQSSLSELVMKMEEQGLLVRTPCPTDRRQVLIAPTEEGLRQLAVSEEADLRQNITYLQVLTEEEQKTLLELLTKLDDGWSALYPKKNCPQQKKEAEQT